MASHPQVAYLSLGSNLGDRLEHLRQGCQALAKLGSHIRATSSVYETEPVDFAEQGWFLNCAVEVETTLPPLELLRAVQQIERSQGRQREIPKGPRTLDIDILLYGDRTMQEEQLMLPHPRMHERRFVLEPLREIAPALRIPRIEKTVEELVAELADMAQVRLFRARPWLG